MKRSGLFKSYTAAVTAFLFLFSSVAWAAPVSAPAEPAVTFTNESARVASLAADLQIPEAIGAVTQRYTGPLTSTQETSPVIIHIEDAHANIDAQQNIRKILRHLNREKKLELLFVEGTLDRLDPDRIRFFKDDSLNLKAAEMLLKKGVLSGAELFLLDHSAETGSTPVSAPGIEDADLYTKNLAAYREVFGDREVSARFLDELKTQITTKSSVVFNKKLKSFFREWVFYQDAPGELMRHLNVLRQYASEELGIDPANPRAQLEWPQLVRYFRLHEMKPETDRTAAESELSRVIQKLGAYGAGSEDLELLRGWTPGREFKSRSYSDLRAFLEHLYASFSARGFHFEDYPALSREWGTAILRSEIHAEELFGEINRLTGRVLDKLTTSGDERALISIYENYLLLKKLFALELISADYEKASRRKTELKPSALARKLASVQGSGTSGIETRAADETFEKAFVFYATASRRDAVMFENMMRRLKASGNSGAVLVTGGFHTRGLQNLFRKNGVAFVDIMPHISDPSANTSYSDILTMKAVPQARRSYVAAPHPEDRLPPEFVFIYDTLIRDVLENVRAEAVQQGGEVPAIVRGPEPDYGASLTAGLNSAVLSGGEARSEVRPPDDNQKKNVPKKPQPKPKPEPEAKPQPAPVSRHLSKSERRRREFESIPIEVRQALARGKIKYRPPSTPASRRKFLAWTLGGLGAAGVAGTATFFAMRWGRKPEKQMPVKKVPPPEAPKWTAQINDVMQKTIEDLALPIEYVQYVKELIALPKLFDLEETDPLRIEFRGDTPVAIRVNPFTMEVLNTVPAVRPYLQSYVVKEATILEQSRYKPKLLELWQDAERRIAAFERTVPPDGQLVFMTERARQRTRLGPKTVVVTEKSPEYRLYKQYVWAMAQLEYFGLEHQFKWLEKKKLFENTPAAREQAAMYVSDARATYANFVEFSFFSLERAVFLKRIYNYDDAAYKRYKMIDILLTKYYMPEPNPIMTHIIDLENALDQERIQDGVPWDDYGYLWPFKIKRTAQLFDYLFQPLNGIDPAAPIQPVSPPAAAPAKTDKAPPRSEIRAAAFSDAALKAEWDSRFEAGYFAFDGEMARRWNAPARTAGEFSVSLSPYTKRLRISPWVQYWIRQIAAEHDPAAFNFTKVPDEERLFKGLDLAGTPWDVLVNKGPRRRYDALLVPQDYSRQLLTYEDVRSFVEFLSMTGAFTFYNSIWGGASVNSKHFQISYSIPPYFSRLEGVPASALEQRGSVSFGLPPEKDFGSNVVMLRSADKEELSKALWIVIQDLQAKNISFNLTGRGGMAVIVPRKDEYPPSYGGGSLGAKESMREFSIVDETFFSQPERQLSANLSKAIQEALLADEPFNRLVESWRQLLSAHLDAGGRFGIPDAGHPAIRPVREALRLDEIGEGDLTALINQEKLRRKQEYFAAYEAEDQGERVPADHVIRLDEFRDAAVWKDPDGRVHVFIRTYPGGRESGEHWIFEHSVYDAGGQLVRLSYYSLPELDSELLIYTSDPSLVDGGSQFHSVTGPEQIEEAADAEVRSLIREFFRMDGQDRSGRPGLFEQAVIINHVSVFHSDDRYKIYTQDLEALTRWMTEKQALLEASPAFAIPLAALRQNLARVAGMRSEIRNRPSVTPVQQALQMTDVTNVALIAGRTVSERFRGSALFEALVDLVAPAVSGEKGIDLDAAKALVRSRVASLSALMKNNKALAPDAGGIGVISTAGKSRNLLLAMLVYLAGLAAQDESGAYHQAFVLAGEEARALNRKVLQESLSASERASLSGIVKIRPLSFAAALRHEVAAGKRETGRGVSSSLMEGEIAEVSDVLPEIVAARETGISPDSRLSDLDIAEALIERQTIFNRLAAELKAAEELKDKADRAAFIRKYFEQFPGLQVTIYGDGTVDISIEQVAAMLAAMRASQEAQARSA